MPTFKNRTRSSDFFDCQSLKANNRSSPVSKAMQLLEEISKKFALFWIFHPLLISTFQQYLFVFVAGFTQKSSVLRPFGFLALFTTSYIALSSFSFYVEPPGWLPRALASAFPQITLTYFERMLVRKVSYSESGTEPEKNDGVSRGDTGSNRPSNFRSRMIFGQEVATSMRGLGTSWEIKGIHRFSAQNPLFTPSPLNFIVSNIFKCILCFFVHNWCVDVQIGLDRRYLRPENVAFFRRLGEISIEEFHVRCIATVATQAGSCCWINGMYSIAGVISVALKPSSVEDWRPIFGNIWEACTMRRFWGWVEAITP
jgi:hypothetical protein